MKSIVNVGWLRLTVLLLVVYLWVLLGSLSAVQEVWALSRVVDITLGVAFFLSLMNFLLPIIR